MDLIVGIATLVGVFFSIFVGKSVIELLNSRRGAKEAKSSKETQSYDAALSVSDYQSRVATSHRRLRFGDPTSNLLTNDKEAQGLSLTDIYIPLSVATEFGSAEPRSVRPVQLRIPVQEALSGPEAHRAVVLGDPGAGKSTLVDYLVLQCLETSPSKLPIHVRLSEISADNEHGLWEGVLEVMAGESPDPKIWSEIERVIQREGGVLLFDGLDEVSADVVPRVLDIIVGACRRFPRVQVVVTCRYHDYYLPVPERQLPGEFTKWRLLPFTLDEMLTYVDRWYKALGALQYISAADERKRNLQDSLRNSPDLEGLAATPLMLALMALVHTTEGELPSARSILYYRAVVHLLADSPEWRSRFTTETVRVDDVFTIATEIAFQIQAREANASVSNPSVGLDIDEIEKVVQRDLVRRNVHKTGQITYRTAVESRVLRIVHSNGLIVEQATGHYRFAHRSLQEFLAGAYLVNGADFPLALSLAGQPAWSEPLVLMAGFGSGEGRSLFFLTRFIEDLINQNLSSLPHLLIAGEMLAEIGKDTLRSQRFERLVDKSATSEMPLWSRTVDVLFQSLDKDITIAERVKLLQVLGRLGDPRIVDSDETPMSLIDRLVSLPPIEITIGDEGRTRPRAKSELVESAPARTVFVDGFRVSLYPVTNYEYRLFVQGGGYSSEQWWLPDGLRWLSGDSQFATELEKSTVDWIHRDFRAELEMGRFRMGDVLRDATAMARPRTEPFYWRNSRYNQNNQPVVGINWWEANAYCTWLTAQMHRSGELELCEEARIPNEWEWERYARGRDDRRAFPWGSDEDTSRRAHTRFDGLDLDAATPVGAFPMGRTPDGLYDVAGNVWEWTSSRALLMSVHHDRHRHNVDSVTDVVVRGGSWFSDIDGAIRCGYRGIDLPQNVYYDVGVRVIVKRTKHGGTAREKSTNS